MNRPAGVPPDAIVRVFRVPPECAGMRADVFLQSQLRNTSRTRARLIVETTAFTPEGKRLRPSDRLRGEDQLVLWRPPFEQEEPAAPIATLFEDEHLLVVDKPAPMTVHPTARAFNNTLLERLRVQRPGEYLSLVHRLDRDTSGILLVARSAEADRAFKRVLEDRSSVEIVRARALSQRTSSDQGTERHLLRAARRGRQLALRKTYLALTKGVPPAGECALPLEHDLDNPLRVKMRVAPPGAGLDARTLVTVHAVRQGYALVECELFTGRQHQIRVHLAALGTPIVGDKLYGPDERLLARAADGQLTAEDEAALELPRQALHAHRYELPHPLAAARLELVSPLPADLRAFWDAKA